MMIDKIKLDENAYSIDREYYSKYDVVPFNDNNHIFKYLI